ncbi:MAG: hypothetical protein WBW04_15920 [Nitrolancea sp.]
MNASVSNASPHQKTEVTVTASITNNGQPVAGAPMIASWFYKTTTSSCAGQTDANGVASCTRYIAGATKGYLVRINVAITWNGQTYTATTSFTPK